VVIDHEWADEWIFHQNLLLMTNSGDDS